MKKTLTTILILAFAIAPTAKAFSLLQYIQGKESVTNSLLNSITVSENIPLISAKPAVDSQEEAILNPVNLVGNLFKKDAAIASFVTADVVQLLQESGNEALINDYLSGDFSIDSGFEDPTDKILSNFILGDIMKDARKHIDAFIEHSGVTLVLEGKGLNGYLYNELFGDGGNPLDKLIEDGDITTVAGVLAFLGVANYAESAITGQAYYGGQLQIWWPCTCGEGAMMVVDDYASDREIILKQDFNGQERIFAEYNIFTPKNNLLGSYNGNTGAVCVVGVDPYCITIPTNGSLDNKPGTGTSLFPEI